MPDIPGDIVIRALQGDRSAFRELVDATAKLAFNIAWRMAYNQADAEDLTQEIFLRLHRNLGQYDPALPFLPWFRTLAVRVCLNWRKQRPRAASIDAMEVEPASEPTEPPQDTGGILDREIEKLPQEYKAVLTCLYFQGMPIAEIAAAMNVPEGTVKTWLFRAREILKEKLKPHEASLL
jgi:RNA polymerase sigma-70 factor (ECF subfamily)